MNIHLLTATFVKWIFEWLSLFSGLSLSLSLRLTLSFLCRFYVSVMPWLRCYAAAALAAATTYRISGKEERKDMCDVTGRVEVLLLDETVVCFHPLMVLMIFFNLKLSIICVYIQSRTSSSLFKYWWQTFYSTTDVFTTFWVFDNCDFWILFWQSRQSSSTTWFSSLSTFWTISWNFCFYLSVDSGLRWARYRRCCAALRCLLFAFAAKI